MAKVTLVLVDTDLSVGRFTADMTVENAMLDDGFITAAHVTGLYLMQSISTPAFAAGVAAFGQTLQWANRSDGAVTASIIFDDVDLDAGQFDAKMEVSEEVPNGITTAAHVTAHFMLAALKSAEFQQGCTLFAQTLVEGRDGYVNEPTSFDATPSEMEVA